MKEEKHNLDKVTFNNIDMVRYVRVKQSIEDLMKIIDVEKVNEDGKERVLAAILQLIDENDEKTIQEKYDIITDAIYNGNIFNHYFKDEVKNQAIDILSRTSLINDDERYIYIINFFMPFDTEFLKTYNKCGKAIKTILREYNLPEGEERLVRGRALEISKFYTKYEEEKARLNRFGDTEALAAMQDASENPTAENIAKVKNLISSLSNDSLKESLSAQLKELEEASMQSVEPVSLNTEMLRDGFDKLGEESMEEKLNVESEEMEKPTEIIEPATIEPAFVANDEPIELTRTDILPNPNSKIESFDNYKEQGNGQNVGQDVMVALQGLVADNKRKTTRVNELEETLEIKNKEVDSLKETIDSQELDLSHKDGTIAEQDKKISSLESELRSKDSDLTIANQKIEMQGAEIASRDEKIEALSASLESYKKSLAEIQQFLSSAQAEVSEQKVM